jgi:hypothetical protein
LPKTSGDGDKAEMLLGYLARSEKETERESDHAKPNFIGASA